jgi:hypothetical protein
MNDNVFQLAAARPRERAFPQPAPDKITIVELRGKIGPDRPVHDDSEGLDEFFGDVRVWFSGFGFGVFACSLAISAGATLWAWLS